MRSFRWILCISVFLAALSHAEPSRLRRPELETLPNGMTIAWYLDDRLPLTTFSLRLQVSDRDDPAGREGLSGLTASLLTRGAGRLGAAALSESVESLGAALRASSGSDSSVAFVHGLSADSAKLLELLALVVREPTFPEADFLKEKARAEEAWRRIGDSPSALAGHAHSILSLQGTAYGRVASLASLKRIQRSDLVAFHRANYVPEGAVMMVLGRGDRARLRSEILARFGDWSGKRTVVPARRPSASPISAQRGQIVIVDRPGSKQSEVLMSWPTASIRSPDRYALAVASTILGGFFESRLNSRLRDQLGLTYGISSSVQHLQLHSLMEIRSSTANATVGKLIRETRSLLAAFGKEGASADEFKLARGYLIGSFPLDVASLEQIAGRWLQGHLMKLGEDYLDEFVPKISALTEGDLRSALQKHLRLDEMTIVVAGDAAEITKSLREAGFSSLKKVSIRELL